MSNTTQSSPGTSQQGLLIAVVSWGALVIAASATGVLGALGQYFMPGYAILVVIGIVVPTFSYFSFPSVRHAVDAIGLRRLTLFHVWRIPAGGLFIYYASSGELPLLFGLIARSCRIGCGDAIEATSDRNATASYPSVRICRLHHCGGNRPDFYVVE